MAIDAVEALLEGACATGDDGGDAAELVAVERVQVAEEDQVDAGRRRARYKAPRLDP